MIPIYKIKYKLLFTFFTLILSSAIIGGISIHYSKQVAYYRKANHQIDQLRVLLLEARKYEKDFLIYEPLNTAFMQTGISRNVSAHTHSLDSIQALIQLLKQNEVMTFLNLQADLATIQNATNRYNEQFLFLSEKIRQRGFKDFGLEGKMRQIAHSLENTATIDQNKLLTLRRHEKDFLIRKDLKYVSNLRQTADLVLQSPIDDASAQAVKQYVHTFDQLVGLEEEIGLHPDKGVRGELRTIAESVEPKIVLIQAVVSKHLENLTADSERTVIGVFLVLLLLSVAVSFYFSHYLSQPIILLDRITRSVVEGLKDQDQLLDNIQTKDETGSLARNFKQMLITLKGSFSEVRKQNERLLATAEEEKLRQWSAEGMAHFSNLLGQTYPDLEAQCAEIVSQLVRYLGANQAGLFVVNDDNPANVSLDLIASYAYNRRKYTQKRVQIGEGLVGQAYLDKAYIYMTDVPENYLNITSGLGEALPRSILIVPMQAHDATQGILELASFRPFSTHEIEFIQKVGERIASTVVTVKNSEKTKALLQNSQQLTEEMRAQEEEMRQNMEELLATQEYYQRSQTEMKQREEELEHQVQLTQQENLTLTMQATQLKAAYEKNAAQLIESEEVLEDLKLKVDSHKFIIRQLTIALKETSILETEDSL